MMTPGAPGRRKTRGLTRDGLSRRVLAALQRQGWRLVHGRHMKAIPPDAARPAVVFSVSPSDHRALSNCIAQLKRSGFIWPEPA